MTGQTTLRVWVNPGKLRGIGTLEVVSQPVMKYEAANPPYRMASSESYLDNKPFGVPVYNLQDYSTSTDVATALNALDAAVTSPCYFYAPRPY